MISTWISLWREIWAHNVLYNVYAIIAITISQSLITSKGSTNLIKLLI